MRKVIAMAKLHNHYTFATGFWQTKQIVTLGLFHFTGPANGYTHSRLRQWDPQRALHGRYGSEIHTSDRKMSLRLSQHVWVYGWHF